MSLRFPLTLLSAVFLFVLPSFSAGAEKKPAARAAAPAAAAPAAGAADKKPAPPAPSDLGVIAQTANQGGVKTCLGRIEQVTGFLAGSGLQGAMVFVDPKQPNHGLASVSQEILNGQALSYVGTAYAPTPDGQCSAVYEAVSFWQGKCEDVAKSVFPTFARSNNLRQHVLVLDAGASAKVFLMPAGNGCVSIKKEVVFQ